MDEHTTSEQTIRLTQIRRGFDRVEQPYAELELGDGKILVSRYGGRIFGPFFGEESLNWISPIFADQETCCQHLERGTWNVGGDRVWLAPELRYNVRDRSRFLESYDLQAAIDPGNYHLTKSGKHAYRLSQEMILQQYDCPQAPPKSLTLERLVRPAADPMRDVKTYAALRPEVGYAGYEQVVSLIDRKPDDRESQVWSITQVPPGGTILIPVVPGAEYEDHLEPVDPAHLQVERHHFRISVRSDRLFKIEVKAAHHFGRFGYFRKHGNGRASLLVKLFFNNPSVPYVMEAPHRPGIRGYSLDIYHDDGGLGGFAELECHGQPVGYEMGPVQSTDQFLTWSYYGSCEAIGSICEQLLGATP